MIDGLMKSELNIMSHYGGQAVVKPLWEKSRFQFLSTLKELGIPWNPTFYLDFLFSGRVYLVSSKRQVRIWPVAPHPTKTLLFKEWEVYHQIPFFPFKSGTLLDPENYIQMSVYFKKTRPRKFYPTFSLKQQHLSDQPRGKVQL